MACGIVTIVIVSVGVFLVIRNYHLMNTLREMTHFPCRRNCCCSLPFLVVCLLLSKNKSPYDVKSFPCPSFLPDQNYHKHTDIYSDTNTNLRVILKVLRNIVVIVVVGIVVLKLVGCNINTKLLLLLSFQSQGNISFFFTSYSNNNTKT